jgi:hypothetical protein
VIFVAALSQYNEVCYEDYSTNKLVESLNLIEEMWKNYFVKAKEIYRGNEVYNVEKFIERFPRKFWGIYITTAVDDNVKDVLTKTFDSVLKLKKRSK